MRPLKEIVVHCSATRPNWMDGKSAAAKMREIKLWHVRDNGWSDIGYHFVIRRNGEIETGRRIFDDGRAEPGAHFAGLNLVSLGICMVGGITEKPAADGAHDPEANFTPEQYTALQALLSVLSEDYPWARVIGHGDPIQEPEAPGSRPVSAKACPSFDVRAWLRAGCPTTGVPTRD